ncbi:uncharacterized protein LOC128737744 [Sabethes cyaneus]|uniref:uncharacterized protein LOC128737744 n=1 Tax=Sabethes cyaneus TaxID=53552 RepID=UPI00237E7567|nr:uncharacterized protein LOC128737744 [Sabethes cyaneus]
MSSADNKQFWTAFIRIYRNHPALWNCKSKLYSDKNVRNEAYNLLIEKAKEITPNADLRFVRAKIESLRASFRRELRKVKASMNRTESSMEDVYEPTLWYYDLLSFLADQEELRPAASPIAKCKTNKKCRIDSWETECPKESPKYSSQPRLKRKTRNEVDNNKEYIIDAAANLLANHSSSAIFGTYVGRKLEEMDCRQRIIAEKLITDVLFHGKMGNLKETAVVRIDSSTSPPGDIQPSSQSNSRNSCEYGHEKQPVTAELIEYDMDTEEEFIIND